MKTRIISALLLLVMIMSLSASAFAVFASDGEEPAALLSAETKEKGNVEIPQKEDDGLGVARIFVIVVVAVIVIVAAATIVLKIVGKKK